MGPVEVEYEGEDDFLKDGLLGFVKQVADLYENSGGALGPDNSTGSQDIGGNGSSSSKIIGTTNQIATKMGVSSGADLILAAGAKLHFVDGKETFTRKDLLEEAKTASKYYKDSNHRKNMGSILQSLVSSNKFNEPSHNTFALTHPTIDSIHKKIAQ